MLRGKQHIPWEGLKLGLLDTNIGSLLLQKFETLSKPFDQRRGFICFMFGAVKFKRCYNISLLCVQFI